MPKTPRKVDFRLDVGNDDFEAEKRITKRAHASLPQGEFLSLDDLLGAEDKYVSNVVRKVERGTIDPKSQEVRDLKTNNAYSRALTAQQKAILFGYAASEGAQTLIQRNEVKEKQKPSEFQKRNKREKVSSWIKKEEEKFARYENKRRFTEQLKSMEVKSKPMTKFGWKSPYTYYKSPVTGEYSSSMYIENGLKGLSTYEVGSYTLPNSLYTAYCKLSAPQKAYFIQRYELANIHQRVEDVFLAIEQGGSDRGSNPSAFLALDYLYEDIYALVIEARTYGKY